MAGFEVVGVGMLVVAILYSMYQKKSVVSISLILVLLILMRLLGYY